MIVLNAPVDLLVSYLQVAREARGVPRPAQFYWLATASSELRIERVDDRTLRVQPAKGFLLTAPERHYRADPRALQPGTEVALSQMTVRVTAQTADGRPARGRVPLRGAPRVAAAICSCASSATASCRSSRPPPVGP